MEACGVLLSRWRPRGIRTADAPPETATNASHSMATEAPAKPSTAAAAAPMANGKRKNEPATAISPRAKVTAITTQIQRHVSGELSSMVVADLLLRSR